MAVTDCGIRLDRLARERVSRRTAIRRASKLAVGASLSSPLWGLTEATHAHERKTVFDVGSYGARGNRVDASDVAVNEGSTVVRSASLQPFRGTRTISISGAGAPDRTGHGYGLLTTIECTTPGTGRLGTSARTGVHDAIASWGKDDTRAIQTAIDMAAIRARETGRQCVVLGHPGHKYLVTYSGPTVAYTGAIVKLALRVANHVALESLNIVAPDYYNDYFQAIVGDNNTGYTNWAIRNCRLSGLAPYGLTTEYGHWAIVFGNSRDVAVSGNHISRMRQSALVSLGHSGHKPSFIKILDNVITLCQGGAIKPDGGATDVWIQRNTIRNNLGRVSGSYPGAEQIFFDSTSGDNQRIHINENRLENWGACVIFGSAYDFDVTGNIMTPPPGGVCIGSYPGGEGVSYGRVAGNRMNPNDNSAVKWSNGATAVAVVDNTFKSTARNGGRFYAETGGKFHGCSVTGNTSSGLLRIVLDSSPLSIARGNIGSPVAVQLFGHLRVPAEDVAPASVDGRAIPDTDARWGAVAALALLLVGGWRRGRASKSRP